MSDLVLKQGLLPVTSHRLDGKTLSVVYRTDIRTCTVRHSEGISVFVNGDLHGSYPITSEETGESFIKLLYVSSYDLYVVVTSKAINILSAAFETVFTAESKSKITRYI